MGRAAGSNILRQNFFDTAVPPLPTLFWSGGRVFIPRERKNLRETVELRRKLFFSKTASPPPLPCIRGRGQESAGIKKFFFAPLASGHDGHVRKFPRDLLYFSLPQFLRCHVPPPPLLPRRILFLPWRGGGDRISRLPAPQNAKNQFELISTGLDFPPNQLLKNSQLDAESSKCDVLVSAARRYRARVFPRRKELLPFNEQVE